MDRRIYPVHMYWQHMTSLFFLFLQVSGGAQINECPRTRKTSKSMQPFPAILHACSVAPRVAGMRVGEDIMVVLPPLEMVGKTAGGGRLARRETPNPRSCQQDKTYPTLESWHRWAHVIHTYWRRVQALLLRANKPPAGEETRSSHRVNSPASRKT